MQLYFIRHAIAVDRFDPAVPDDAERWLTPEGIQKMERAVCGLASVLTGIDHIYTSPYVRALQTASIVAEGFSNAPVTEIDLLMMGLNCDSLRKVTDKHQSHERLAFVGHEPDLSFITAELIGDPRASIIMKKGAVSRVDVMYSVAEGAGELKWLLQPAILRALA